MPHRSTTSADTVSNISEPPTLSTTAHQIAGGVPVIVIGKSYTVLGALRCLAAAGHNCYVAAPADDLVTHSKYYRPLPGSDWDGSINDDTLDKLTSLPFEKAVLIPCADDVTYWLSGLPLALRKRFFISISDTNTLDILQNKTRFGEFLRQMAIAHPRTFSVTCNADVEAIPFADLDRVFIKPADSQSFSQTLGIKGVWANDAQQFRIIWKDLSAKGFQIIAQEYVPGSSRDHYFVDGFRDRHGKLTGLFARRRERIYPPDFGNSSYSRSIPLNDVKGAIDSVETLLSGLNYRGIFSAEFKQDQRDGQFRILEVNTRAWWYVEFAARCGVNVCDMAYHDALGLPVSTASTDYALSKDCINLPNDIKSVLAQPAASRQSWFGYLRQWLGADLHVFYWRDPLPGLRVTVQMAMRWVKKRLS